MAVGLMLKRRHIKEADTCPICEQWGCSLYGSEPDRTGSIQSGQRSCILETSVFGPVPGWTGWTGDWTMVIFFKCLGFSALGGCALGPLDWANLKGTKNVVIFFKCLSFRRLGLRATGLGKS